ncbi:MAG: AraC family transcriptional regulator [Porticoccaceae bacterium]|nr:AraC family transcriptional regulator [Porticoccaceae bacterium]
MHVAIKEAPKSLIQNKHELFRSTDLDETRSLVGDVYCDHKLQISSGALDAFHYHIPFDGISFNYMGYGAECIIEPGCLGDFYLLQLPLKGTATIFADGREFQSHPGKASILNPNSYTKMRWSGGCEQLLVQIEKRKVNSSLAGYVGRKFCEEVSFNPNISENDEKQSAWWRHVVSFIREYNQANSFYQTQCVLNNELDTIVKNLLFTLDHNHSETLVTTDRAVLPKHVHQATEHIREHFSENLSIHDLVKLTGVSERCLFEGFKQNLTVTPMQFLMQTRLKNVRGELLKNSFDDFGNITQVALDNGFTQLGRFSSYYKDMFGELPSQTVKGRKNCPDA